MTATERSEGLARLGVLHQTTLPYSPYQNGKQETFCGQIEGRLMAMLEGVDDLTLVKLNQATQASVGYSLQATASLLSLMGCSARAEPSSNSPAGCSIRARPR